MKLTGHQRDQEWLKEQLQKQHWQATRLHLLAINMCEPPNHSVISVKMVVHFHPIIQNHPKSSVDMALSQGHPNLRALTPILPIQLARMVASALFLNTCTCHDHQNKRVIHLLIFKGPICVLFGSYSYPNPHLSWNSPAGSQPSRPCPCWWGALQIPRWLRCWWVPIASWNASAILSLALGTSKQGDL